MLDEQLRQLELAAKTGTPMERLAARHRLKQAGGSAGLDLSIPFRCRAINAKTYGQGLSELRSVATEIQPFYQGRARPLTFTETWQVLALEYEEYGPRSGLFQRDWTTSSGALYQAGKKKFKLVDLAEELLAVELDQTTLETDYGKIVEPALRIKNGYYNQRLERDLVCYHPAWGNALRSHKLLYQAIRVAFDRQKYAMPFIADKTFPYDTLVPLKSLSIANYFAAGTAQDLRDPCFLNIIPALTPNDDSDSDCDGTCYTRGEDD